MTVDYINIHGKSYYYSSLTFDNTNSAALVLQNFTDAFLGTPGNAAAGKGVTGAQMLNWKLDIPAEMIRAAMGVRWITYVVSHISDILAFRIYRNKIN